MRALAETSCRQLIKLVQGLKRSNQQTAVSWFEHQSTQNSTEPGSDSDTKTITPNVNTMNFNKHFNVMCFNTQHHVEVFRHQRFL